MADERNIPLAEEGARLLASQLPVAAMSVEVGLKHAADAMSIEAQAFEAFVRDARERMDVQRLSVEYEHDDHSITARMTATGPPKADSR